ncbi:MAG: GNAT family N-acetyltransferase [Deltaproteobacteria bacterium]|nr:GNAT family N-acetyltransferase [Deltaproteobacteria bacterium]
MLRRARPNEIPEITRTMKASARELGKAFYGPDENASFEAYVAVCDVQLVDDGTYFVVEGDEATPIAACGGWSKRDKLFTGNDGQAGGARLLSPGKEPARVRAMFVHPSFARRGLGRKILEACEADARAAGFSAAEMMATLPGVPLYRACGYADVAPFDVMLPNGLALPCLRMTKAL